MKKSLKKYCIFWSVCFLLFHIVVFVISNISKKIKPFWTGYFIVLIIFLIYFLITYLLQKKEKNRNHFLKIPLIVISYIGLLINVFIGILTMTVSLFPIWLGNLIGLIVCLATAAVIGGAEFAGNFISDTNRKIRNSTFFMKNLAVDAEHLSSVAKTSEMKKVTNKVYEAIRYSDYTTTVGLAEMNENIRKKFCEFESAVEADDVEIAKIAGDELISFIDKRNKENKMMKK